MRTHPAPRHARPNNVLLSATGTTISTVMSALVNQQGAFDLGQ